MPEDKFTPNLMHMLNDLIRRVTALEEKEFAIMHSGSGAPTHSAAEGTFYWDYTNDCLYVNSDGSTTWLECCCSGGA